MAAPEARFEGGKGKIKCSEVVCTLSRLTRVMVALER